MLRVDDADDAVRFDVEDNGPGKGAGEARFIFDKFQQFPKTRRDRSKGRWSGAGDRQGPGGAARRHYRSDERTGARQLFHCRPARRYGDGCGRSLVAELVR